jgi:predicted nucleic acid-binding protein
MRYLVDTNILLRRVDIGSPDNPVCGSAVEKLIRAGHELVICAQVLIEFRSVATRPRDVNGLGLTSAAAVAHNADLREAFLCLPEPPDMADRWQVVADQYSVLGKQAHDARIAALMIAHGITHLLTLNPSDFTRYAEITAITPQEIL